MRIGWAQDAPPCIQVARKDDGEPDAREGVDISEARPGIGAGFLLSGFSA
ncbi:MAG: hypothetical protein JMN25_06965 [gamma proteobacterium endosymbiont of Lamellibrachia anaximandri]|nr:hypothetical protein [gamma proteobacterium endosymbiont of Lamellibrachia anaximandri]